MTTLFLILLSLQTEVPDRYRIADPSAPQRVDYLIVAGTSFANELAPLADHRSKQGYAVGIVSYSDIAKFFDSLRSFLAHAHEKWEPPFPRFLLLVGDVDTLPTSIRKGEYGEFLSEADVATDFDAACPKEDLAPELHVGRFPCDTVKELRDMIGKTIEYERAPTGLWQQRIRFVAGAAGFSAEADRLIESQFRRIVTGNIPPNYDTEIAFAMPRSPYCPFPPRFNGNTLRMLNEGSLLYVYVGHGDKTEVDRIRWNGERHRIFRAEDSDHVSVTAGSPVMIMLACHTGRFDGETDCLGEILFRNPKGPVAFLGGSRVTQPYGNALLGEALVAGLFGETKTLGEAITRAKVAVLKHEKNALTAQADLFAAQVQGKEALEPMRRDVVRHYNLFGDPALVLRRPADSIRMTRDGSRVILEATVKEVRLTLECRRDKMAHPIEKSIGADDPECEAKMMERYRLANDKVISVWTVTLQNGKGSQEIDLPQEKGRYVLKASAPGLASAIEVTVP